MENHTSAENQHLIDNSAEGHYEFDHPDISVDLQEDYADRNNQKKMRVVLKYPDGSLSHGKFLTELKAKSTTNQIPN